MGPYAWAVGYTGRTAYLVTSTASTSLCATAAVKFACISSKRRKGKMIDHAPSIMMWGASIIGEQRSNGCGWHHWPPPLHWDFTGLVATQNNNSLLFAVVPVDATLCSSSIRMSSWWTGPLQIQTWTHCVGSKCLSGLETWKPTFQVCWTTAGCWPGMTQSGQEDAPRPDRKKASLVVYVSSSPPEGVTPDAFEAKLC